MSFLNLMRNRLKPKEVNDALMDVEGRVLPVTTSASTGQILKLTGETKTPEWADEYSYTPPAYSTTEVNTGQKWIDGKDIYSITISNNFPVLGTETNVTLLDNFSNEIVFISGYAITSSGNRVPFNTTFQSMSLNAYQSIDTIVSRTTPNFSECAYCIVLYYTKADPVPETREDDTEPEEKKTTKKKTTK